MYIERKRAKKDPDKLLYKRAYREYQRDENKKWGD